MSILKALVGVTLAAIAAEVLYLGTNIVTQDPVVAAVTLAGGLVLLAVIAFACFWKIPPNCFAERRFFGVRLPGVVEGWTFWPPFEGWLKTFSILAESVSGEVSFVTSNNLKLTIPYYMERRADPTLLDNRGRVVVLGKESDVTDADIKAEIEARLGALGGIRTSDDFKKDLKRVEDYLRSFLQRSVPLHTRHDQTSCAVCATLPADERFPQVVPDDRILEFYRIHWKEIRADIKDEPNHPEDHSPLEERCGIDVVLFRLMNPKYTAETESALEKEGQEKARARGLIVQREEAVQLMNALNISGEEALDAAQVALLGTPKKIVAVRGGGQALIVEGGFPGFGGGGDKPARDSGGKPRKVGRK